MLVELIKFVTSLPPAMVRVGTPGAVGAVVSITRAALEASDSGVVRPGSTTAAALPTRSAITPPLRSSAFIEW